MKSLKEFNVTGKRILVRCDFNVPIDERGNISDDFRIIKTLPTIKYLLDARAKVILMSHLGEPDGKNIPELRMNKIAERLSEYLKFSVIKADDCVGPEIESAANSLEDGGLLLLENLRFHNEEIENDPDFSRKLSFLGDIYVNDAFSVCHRDHASISGVPQLMPDHCAGLLLKKEIDALDKATINPDTPMIAIVGGKKVETKSKFIDNISRVADFVIVSGLIAKEITDKNIKLEYPDKIIIPSGKLDDLDINNDSIKAFRGKILQARTILWNGPFGKFEEDKYEIGTLEIAKAITDSGAFSVVGGGETVEFINKKGMIDKFSHVSTGGGAMLSYLAGDKLPGIKVLG